MRNHFRTLSMLPIVAAAAIAFMPTSAPAQLAPIGSFPGFSSHPATPPPNKHSVATGNIGNRGGYTTYGNRAGYSYGRGSNVMIPQPPKHVTDSSCSRSTPCRITIAKGYGYNGYATNARGFNGRGGYVHNSAIAIGHIK